MDGTTDPVLADAEGLAGAGEPGAVEACAHACSLGEADAANVAGWLDALAARMQRRIEEADSWS